jgi:putative spermidine/putrescine transport system ATP-binding protein
MSRCVLELVDVTKRYGSVAAVERLSLQLAQGEFLSLLGPSGSGKTTTLQMIAGLAQPSAGEILLAGRPIGRCRLTSAGSAWCFRTTRYSRI